MHSQNDRQNDQIVVSRDFIGGFWYVYQFGKKFRAENHLEDPPVVYE